MWLWNTEILAQYLIQTFNSALFPSTGRITESVFKAVERCEICILLRRDSIFALAPSSQDSCRRIVRQDDFGHKPNELKYIPHRLEQTLLILGRKDLDERHIGMRKDRRKLMPMYQSAVANIAEFTEIDLCLTGIVLKRNPRKFRFSCQHAPILDIGIERRFAKTHIGMSIMEFAHCRFNLVRLFAHVFVEIGLNLLFEWIEP